MEKISRISRNIKALKWSKTKPLIGIVFNLKGADSSYIVCHELWGALLPEDIRAIDRFLRRAPMPYRAPTWGGTGYLDVVLGPKAEIRYLRAKLDEAERVKNIYSEQAAALHRKMKEAGEKLREIAAGLGAGE